MHQEIDFGFAQSHDFMEFQDVYPEIAFSKNINNHDVAFVGNFAEVIDSNTVDKEKMMQFRIYAQ